MQRLLSQCHLTSTSTYCLNLDPAVGTLPYQANIDIRDTVNYRQVMKQYNLGPNGGILTSLNLFATRFDQVLGFIDKRAKDTDLVFVDTPGQIEIFTWSASGSIISDSLAATYPTVILYVVDTPRTTSPVTFMSNMLYACSIMYKSKLPFLLVFNKTDVTSHAFAQEWMSDLDAFTQALKSDESYMSSLTRSMSLVLEEFYATIRSVGVSAMSGAGMEEMFKAIDELGAEYESVYRPAMDAARAEAEEEARRRKERQMNKLKQDIEKDEHTRRGEKVVLEGGKATRSKQHGSARSSTRDFSGDGIIQVHSQESRYAVRADAEDAADIGSDEEDAFADEEDVEYRAYDEEGEGEGEDGDYANDAEAERERREFAEFMAKMRATDPVRPAAAASASAASSRAVGRGGSIPEGNEEADEEIEIGRKQ